jgi:hypothetical protein
MTDFLMNSLSQFIGSISSKIQKNQPCIKEEPTEFLYNTRTEANEMRKKLSPHKDNNMSAVVKISRDTISLPSTISNQYTLNADERYESDADSEFSNHYQSQVKQLYKEIHLTSDNGSGMPISLTPLQECDVLHCIVTGECKGYNLSTPDLLENTTTAVSLVEVKLNNNVSPEYLNTLSKLAVRLNRSDFNTMRDNVKIVPPVNIVIELTIPENHGFVFKTTLYLPHLYHIAGSKDPWMFLYAWPSHVYHHREMGNYPIFEKAVSQAITTEEEEEGKQVKQVANLKVTYEVFKFSDCTTYSNGINNQTMYTLLSNVAQDVFATEFSLVFQFEYEEKQDLFHGIYRSSDGEDDNDNDILQQAAAAAAATITTKNEPLIETRK